MRCGVLSACFKCRRLSVRCLFFCSTLTVSVCAGFHDGGAKVDEKQELDQGLQVVAAAEEAKVQFAVASVLDDVDEVNLAVFCCFLHLLSVDQQRPFGCEAFYEQSQD